MNLGKKSEARTYTTIFYAYDFFSLVRPIYGTTYDFIDIGKKFFVANRMVKRGYDCAIHTNMFCWNDGDLSFGGSYSLFEYFGDEEFDDAAVRPLVFLKESIKTDGKNSEGEWKIIE